MLYNLACNNNRPETCNCILVIRTYRLIMSCQLVGICFYIDQFHHDFHTRSFSGLPFSMFQYCSYQNENFTIHLQIWSVNMIWCQIVERLIIRWRSVERTIKPCQQMSKYWILHQFDIKSCLLIIFEDEWWNSHFERSNTDISKNVSWKALNCESRGEIDQI